MGSLPLSDGRTTISGAERVLLSFQGERDRDLLRSWLEDEFEVREGSPETADEFDLCLVDERSYDAFEDALAARREEATPLFLPVLLLAGDPRTVPDHADDVVVLPTRTELLGSRIRSLLRTRRLTRQVSLFRRAMDEATVGVCVSLATDDQPLVYVNETFERITGYDREEILGRNCRFLQGPDTDPEAVAELREAVADGQSTRTVLRNYRADGTPFWNEVSIMPVREGGVPTHFVGFQADVTERIERQRELEQYETIIRSMHEAAWVLDTERRLVFLNPKASVPMDLQPEELLGEPIDATAGLFPDDQLYERYSRYVDEILAGEREEGSLTFEVALSDARLALEVTLAPMESGGEIEGVVALARDVSERVERDQRISVLDRVLRHNLRNKLNVVLANAQDLREVGDPDVTCLSDSIEAAAMELLGLSDTARRFESAIQPEEGAVRPVDVSAHVSHAVEAVSLVHDVDIETHLPDGVRALAHESLQLALEELIDNAVIHADDAPSVSVTVTDRPDEELVEVTVADTGPGLPEMEQAALLRGSETPLEHMEGLGIWFANWTVTASGGQVAVRDNVPRGTVVTVTLPRA